MAENLYLKRSDKISLKRSSCVHRSLHLKIDRSRERSCKRNDKRSRGICYQINIERDHKRSWGWEDSHIICYSWSTCWNLLRGYQRSLQYYRNTYRNSNTLIKRSNSTWTANTACIITLWNIDLALKTGWENSW